MRGGPPSLPPGHELIYGQRYNRYDEPVWEVQESSPSRSPSPNRDAIGISAWQIRQLQRNAPDARRLQQGARARSPDAGSSPRNFATPPSPSPSPSPRRSPSPQPSGRRRKKGLSKLFGCLTCGKPSTSGSPGGSAGHRSASPGASARTSPSHRGSRRGSGSGSGGQGSRAASPEQGYYHPGSSGAWLPWGQ